MDDNLPSSVFTNDKVYDIPIDLTIIEPPTNRPRLISPVAFCNLHPSTQVAPNLSFQNSASTKTPIDNRPEFLSFIHSSIGSQYLSSILVIAKSEGYGNTLTHGKRNMFFAKHYPVWFANGGLFCQYKSISFLKLKTNFSK